MSRFGSSYNSRRRDLTRLIVADHSGVPENGLVMGKSFFTLTKMRLIIRPAYRVFRPADFGQILIDAFEASVSLSKRIDPLRALTAHQNPTGILAKVREELNLAVRLPGSVLNCGKRSLNMAGAF
jgi:hypothetical protein